MVRVEEVEVRKFRIVVGVTVGIRVRVEGMDYCNQVIVRTRVRDKGQGLGLKLRTRLKALFLVWTSVSQLVHNYQNVLKLVVRAKFKVRITSKNQKI